MAALADHSENENTVKPLPHQISTYDLFKDNALKTAFNSLPKEEQDKYKRQGENMYSIDYDSLGVQGTDSRQKIIEDAAYIGEGLKSGLRPSQLDKDEIEVMQKIFGKRWFEKYGYKSEED
jgi:endo-alpha-1,4-polygalactosaminidase (GH114 family)